MRKYKLISALAEEIAKDVVRNEESWRRYLNTASRLYKYPFKEQLLIYAQRPDATSCASIEIWNEKMHCWVNKGAKGIALIDEDSFSGLKYVFDISDVNKARRIGRFPNLWEMRDEHIEAVISRLEKTYGDTDKEAGFVGCIREIAGRIAEDCYKDLASDMEYLKEGSFFGGTGRAERGNKDKGNTCRQYCLYRFKTVRHGGERACRGDKLSLYP